MAPDRATRSSLAPATKSRQPRPLTPRTVRFISQSTITEREVNSDPDVPDHNSTLYGPGFVAPVGVGGHFPPGIAETPQVDLFEIEHTNRDGTFHPNAGRNLPER